MKRIAGLTFKIAFVLLLFVVFFSYAMFQGGFVSWFLFYSFLPIILYLFLFLLYPISNWQVTREISKSTLEASEKADIVIKINRKLPFPVYYCIIEEILPASLHYQDLSREKYRHMGKENALTGRRTVRQSVFPWLQKDLSISYQLDALPRGDHQLRAVRVKCGDFFGFVKKEYIFELKNHVLVYPARREVKMKENTSSMDGGSSVTYNRHSKSSNVVTGVREYVPGDRFSWIDWKSTARRNTVMTKEFEQEKSTEILLILDSVIYPELNRLAFEGSVELAASLVESLRKRETPFSFMSLGKEKKIFPFQSAPGNRRKIFYHLAKLIPGENEKFAYLLTNEISKFSSGSVLMAVTTNLDEDTAHALERVKRKSKRVILFLISPERKVLQKKENLVRELKENGIIVNTISEENLVQNKFEVNS